VCEWSTIADFSGAVKGGFLRSYVVYIWDRYRNARSKITTYLACSGKKILITVSVPNKKAGKVHGLISLLFRRDSCTGQKEAAEYSDEKKAATQRWRKAADSSFSIN